MGARDELHGHDPGPLPTHQPELFSLEEEPGGLRPDRMPSLSGSQERVQRRTVQQIVDPVPLLPTLDDPAPQMVEQLPDTLHFLRALSPDPEQAIEVPKIARGRPSANFGSRAAAGGNSWSSSRCSGLRSRTSTFQLMVVVELVEVFPGFLPG